MGPQVNSVTPGCMTLRHLIPFASISPGEHKRNNCVHAPAASKATLREAEMRMHTWQKILQSGSARVIT